MSLVGNIFQELKKKIVLQQVDEPFLGIMRTK